MIFVPKHPNPLSMLDATQILTLHYHRGAILRFILPCLCWLSASLFSAYLIYAEFSRHEFLDQTWKYWLGLFVFLWFVTFASTALTRCATLIYAWPRFYTQLKLSPQGLCLQGLHGKTHDIPWSDIRTIQDICPHDKNTPRYLLLILAPEHSHRLQTEWHIDKPYFTQQAQKLSILLPTWQWRGELVTLAVHHYWHMYTQSKKDFAAAMRKQQAL